MKEAINVFDYASHILKALRGGVLLTTHAHNKINTMTISWGTLGIDWQTPIFTAFVRENRLTRSYLDANPQFTVNIPFELRDLRTLSVAGSTSGRYMDKITELGLHLEEPEKISVPGLREFPLTLECVVIYRQPQEGRLIPEEIRDTYHPQHIDSYAPGLNRDFHTAYYGAIVASYIIRQ